MTTMIKSTPEEQLEFVLQEIEQATASVSSYTEAQEKAQKRAETTTGLAKAAQLEFSNADAKYRVLFESTKIAAARESAQQDRYTNLQERYAAASGELDRAKEINTAVETVQNTVGAAIAAADACDDATKDAVRVLGRLVTDLGKAGTSPDAKAALAPFVKQIRDQRTKLQNIQTNELETNISKAKTENLQMPAPPELKPLEDWKAKLGKELAEAASPYDKPPAIDPADLQKAKKERDTALTALVEMPHAERKAQSDLQAVDTALADAQHQLDMAKQARDKVESSIITRLDMDRPDPDHPDLVEVKAVFATGSPPRGYELHWTTDAGKLRESVGAVVHLETKGISASRFTVEAHLDRN